MHRWQALIRTVAAAALLSVSTAVLAADEVAVHEPGRGMDPGTANGVAFRLHVA